LEQHAIISLIQEEVFPAAASGAYQNGVSGESRCRASAFGMLAPFMEEMSVWNIIDSNPNQRV